MTDAGRLRVAVFGDLAGLQTILEPYQTVSLDGDGQFASPDCVIVGTVHQENAGRLLRSAVCGAGTLIRLDRPGEHRSDEARLGFRRVLHATPATLADTLADEAKARAQASLRLMVEAATEAGVQVRLLTGDVRACETICEARLGQAATVERIAADNSHGLFLHLSPSLRLSPGDVLCRPDERPQVADQFAVRLLWTADEPLIAGRTYRLHVGGKMVAGSVTSIKHRIEADIPEPLAAKTLRKGEVGVLNISLQQSVAFDLAETSGDLRRVEVLDASASGRLGQGVLDYPLRRASNIHWQNVTVSKPQRAAIKAQKPVLIWFTGLSGSGKSTVANLLEARLLAAGYHTYLLDGDNVRHGLNRDLGFTDADRVENIRRVGEIAKLMVDAGLIVLASFISPFRAERTMARELLEDGEFIEVFVDAPLSVAEERDPKGLYRRARRGELRNFTGIDSPYEVPERPELRLDTSFTPAEVLAERVFTFLLERGHIGT